MNILERHVERKYLVVGAVLIWTLLIFAVSKLPGFYRADREKSMGRQAIGWAKNSESRAAGGKAYRYGFSFNCPDDWVELDRAALRKKDPTAVAGFRKSGYASNPSMIVKIEKVGPVDSGELLAALRDRLKSELEDFKEVASGGAKIGIADSVSITYTWLSVPRGPGEGESDKGQVNQRGIRLKQRMIIGMQDGWAYYLILSAHASDFDKLEDDFARMVASFSPNSTY